MTNFDFLKKESQFAPFADTAILAETLFHIDFATSVITCRKAMEFAVKWMYSVDKSLVMPYQDKLVTLINTDEFKDVITSDLFKRLDFIRRLGNNANHKNDPITKDQASLALNYLHDFMDFITYCYAKTYTQTIFNLSLAEKITTTLKTSPAEPDFNKIINENKPFKLEYTARREEKKETYISTPLDFTEDQTRKAYIDVMLTSVGFKRGVDWFDEYEIENMPNKSGIGFADYVLLGDDGKPLAVIEAKKTSVDISKGRQQAKLYADDIERRFNRRPIVFLTNGFDTSIISADLKNGYPEHKVSGIYSKRDLEKEFNKYTMKTPLDDAKIDDNISDRYYQKEAIKAVCERFDKHNQRKALLVMATGSGKTRTIISLVDILTRHGWVTNFLFLADRNSLVTQAKRSFNSLMPNLSTTNLVDDKENSNARGVFSTYQTIINQIDSNTDENGDKLFTPGHFDLIIVDEAHRSIYNKYKDIFLYFDALLVGLTATPINDIDKNTYEIFNLAPGEPTYGYELDHAVQDKFLVDYSTIETVLKFPTTGIVLNDLPDDEKEEYEQFFSDEDGEIPELIDGSAINSWVYNKDTIIKVLDILMTSGLKVDYGSKIGKTIIFAKKHEHAEKILEVWNAEYPHYPNDYCKVIDNYINYSQSLIDDFADKNKMPQIVISVDMLDTGIDIPEILNLVFFKNIASKSKFWQMIGRGTRLCNGLIDGEDKKEFYIFDFCNNFEFFRLKNGDGKEAQSITSLQEQLFNIKLELVHKLQDHAYQTDELIIFRDNLITKLIQKVCELDRDNFAVKQHLRSVDTFKKIESYQKLTYAQTLEIKEYLSPLLHPYADEYTALRFDILMHVIELASILGENYTKHKNDLKKKISALGNYGTIPDVKKQSEFLKTLAETDYINRAGIHEFETIRLNLRNLMKYIEGDVTAKYDTNFTDTIISSITNKSTLIQGGLENYKEKLNHYIRQNDNNLVIMKLKTNQPLRKNDIVELEKILWSELGTKDDYLKEYGDKPLGELIRSIVGLDMQVAKEAFSEFLNDIKLDTRQIYFINQVVNYIVKNGMIKDLEVLQSSPFTDEGNIADLFSSGDPLWDNIFKTITSINTNADVA